MANGNVDIVELLLGATRDSSLKKSDAVVDSLLEHYVNKPQEGAAAREEERRKNAATGEQIAKYGLGNVPIVGGLLKLVEGSPVGSIAKAALPEALDIALLGAEPTGASPFSFTPGLGRKATGPLNIESATRMIASYPGLTDEDRARYLGQIGRIADIQEAESTYKMLEGNVGKSYGLPPEEFANLKGLQDARSVEGAGPSATSKFVNAVMAINNRRDAAAKRRRQASEGISYTVVEENVLGEDGKYKYDPVSGLPVKQE